MATKQQGPDPIVEIESMSSLDPLAIDATEKLVDTESLNGQTLSTGEEKVVPSSISCDPTDPLKDATSQLGSGDVGGVRHSSHPPNIYAPQAQTIYYGGYEKSSGEWEEYPPYPNAEGMEVGSTGGYNENPSLIFHSGYGYNPQMPYGPYSPVTTPLPSASGDGQLYSPQHFPFTGPYFQQPVSPSMPYITSSTPMSQAELTVPIDHQGAFLADTFNSNGMLLGQGPNYNYPYGSSGRGSFSGNSGNHGFYDLRQGFDVFGSGGFWSDWVRSPDGTGSLPSPAASPQPVGSLGLFGQSIAPLASGMASQEQRHTYGFGSSITSYDRGYHYGGMYHRGGNYGCVPSLGMSNRSFIALDKGRRRGKGNASLCSCNGTLDFLTEQNRGPRATRPKNSTSDQSLSPDSTKSNSTAVPNRELYNRPDFITEYNSAKFFIIKSYSEDNVHKSIKYGVWASTATGNKKLDSAFREAKEMGDTCPVFLFFSVNASAQFCGVAEMIGPVDFEKSVDYWQQDKWSGQFPVRWHIVKDVPNNSFRHIVLENNENKPVTNSRDTQEVKLEQGLEMLKLFKNHESDLSILDDFDFYEGREKAMQERKVQQQQQSNSRGAAVGNERQMASSVSGDFMTEMSKEFSHALQLEGSNEEDLTADNTCSGGTSPAEPEDQKKPPTMELQSSQRR